MPTLGIFAFTVTCVFFMKVIHVLCHINKQLSFTVFHPKTLQKGIAKLCASRAIHVCCASDICAEPYVL